MRGLGRSRHRPYRLKQSQESVRNLFPVLIQIERHKSNGVSFQMKRFIERVVDRRIEEHSTYILPARLPRLATEITAYERLSSELVYSPGAIPRTNPAEHSPRKAPFGHPFA